MTAPSSKSSVAPSERWLLLGLVLLALALRLWTVGDRPFDGDEAIIAVVATSGDIALAAARDVHPPLYHFLVSAVVGLFGVSTWSMRLVGVLAGAALVGLSGLIGRRLGANPLHIGLALAVSPFLVNLSQDARMYSLFVFLATASVLAWFAVLETPKRLVQQLIFVGTTSALVYTHHLGWFVLALELLCAVLVYRTVLISFWQRSLILVAMIGALYLPQLPTTIVQLQGRLGEQAISIGIGAAIKGVVGLLYRTFAGRIYLDLSPGSFLELLKGLPLSAAGLALTLVIAGFALWQAIRFLMRLGTPIARSLIILIGCSLGLGVLVGTVGTQASRYLSFLVPWLIAAGWVSVSQLPRALRTIGLVALMSISLVGLAVQYGRHNQSAGTPVIAEYLDQYAQPSEPVVVRGSFGGGESWTLNYYLSSDHQIIDLFGDYSVGNLDELREVSPAQAAGELLKSSPVVWFYDQTYVADPLAGVPTTMQIETIELGVADKEGQALRLYRLTGTEER